MVKKNKSLLSRIPLTEIHWSEVPDRLDERTIRRNQRSLADTQFTILRQQVCGGHYDLKEHGH
jgi:hypothetical protein